MKLERRDQDNKSSLIGGVILLGPAVDEDYWTYRVIVGEHQAILGFPKFSTIGIGFAVESDGNTNLPYTSDTERIWEHIKRNKGDEKIPDSWCIEAIRMIQQAATTDRQVSQ